MKTTLDLPDALLSELKLRAEHQGEELNDTVAELLRQGLAASAETPAPLVRLVVKTHPRTGLPYVECPHGASADEEMTPERVRAASGRRPHRHRR